MTSLVSFDYIPIYSKSQLLKDTSDKAAGSGGDVQAIVKSLHEFSEKAGQFGFMEEGSDGPKDGKGGWGASVNYLLGFITVGLVIYFMMLLRGNRGGSSGGWGSSRSGGLFGRKGGKAGGMPGSKGGFSGRGGSRR